MTARTGVLDRWTTWAGVTALVLGVATAGPAAHGQAQGRGAGTIVFVNRRPPREIPNNFNPRAWANGARVTNYNEDVATHMWRVSFMVFLPRAPNAVEVNLAWFHVEGNGVRRYISNEPISLSSPGERIFFHTTTLRRGVAEFQPMERYEAVLSVNDARGARNLASGNIQLIGQIERHSGVVDFTRENPQAQ